MAYKYDSPTLPTLIQLAIGQYEQLVRTLAEIQDETGIPGLHMSGDEGAGVLERIQAIHDDGCAASLEVFREFDN
jgi:hypothetical protein